ncbi:MAG: hypothetical protein VZR02_01450 [Lachnospiraceae bacterium]|nr:hypothetical protein [Lachnospiraceae bacterium]
MDHVKEGAVLLVNSIALGGAGRLLGARRAEIDAAFPAFFVSEAETTVENALQQSEKIRGLVEMKEIRAHSLYLAELGEGGLYNALWNMGEALETGMIIDSGRIRVLQEVIEILDLFDVNPYYTDGKGAWLFVSTNAARDAWTFHEAGIFCDVIGILTPPPARKIISGTKKEHMRSLDRPQPDALAGILPRQPL